MPTPPAFPIVPARPTGMLPVVALVAVPMLFAAASAGRTDAAPLAVRVLLHGVLALVAALLGASLHGARRGRVVLAPEGLRLAGDLYGRRAIPYAELDAAGARVVDLRAERTLRPTLRTFGTAFPGYEAGWFRLAGGARALCMLTTRDRVVHVPTRRGYALLLSVQRPDALVAALQERAAPAAR